MVESANNVVILCNGREIQNHGAVKGGELKLTIKLSNSANIQEVKPAIFISERGLSYRHEGTMRPDDMIQVEPNSWEITWKTLDSKDNPNPELLLVLAHPSFGLRVTELKVVNEEAGYWLFDAEHGHGFCGTTFDIKINPGILCEGKRGRIIARSKRYSKDFAPPKYAEAPDAPCLSIKRSDCEDIPAIYSAVRYGYGFLFPLVHDGDGLYKVIGLDLSKLSAGVYDFGVHMRCDLHFNYGHETLFILTKEEYNELGVLGR